MLALPADQPYTARSSAELRTLRMVFQLDRACAYPAQRQRINAELDEIDAILEERGAL